MKRVLFLHVLVLISTGIFAQSLQDSLLFFIPFNGNVNDYSGNGINMTPVNMTYSADRHGISNGAGEFDGIDNYLIIPNISRLKVQMPVTISFWVFPESYAIDQTKFISTEAQYDDYLGYRINCSENGAGQVRCGFGGGLGFAGSPNRRTKNSDSTLTGGKWYNITCIYRGYSDMDIYINCVNAGGYYDGSGPTTVAYENTNGRIGSYEGTVLIPETFLVGRLDDMAMWHRELSYAEVTFICDSSLTSIFGYENIEPKLIQSVFPNPFVDQTKIVLDKYNPDYVFLLYNVLGQQVYETPVTSQEIIVNRNNLNSGIYFIHICDGEKVVDSEMLVIQ